MSPQRLGATFACCWLAAWLCVSCSDEAVSGDKAAKAAADASSFDGLAVDAAVTTGCPKGFAGCKSGVRWVCNDQGSGFVQSPCPDKLQCSEGQCVQCSGDSQCQAGVACVAGTCQIAPLSVVTTALPTGLANKPYKAQLEAKGGEQPYAWSLSQGALPAGLTLLPDGAIDGAAKAAGSYSLQVQVQDKSANKANQVLALEIKDGGLVVTSTSPLKAATDGVAYSLPLTAQGGTAPYFWGITAGKLPTGIALGSDGVLTGTPQGDGEYTFDVKVFDNADAPLVATKSLVLPVKLAPLEIVGTQEINLFITKVIVLPLIIVVDQVPVPYNSKLQAKGGKKPYKWAETPLPGMVKGFLPNAGIPKGLTLAADGSLSGAVTDASLVLELKVPLSQIVLKGFFFAAEVTDSQSKPQTRQAIFIMPTVPVGGP